MAITPSPFMLLEASPGDGPLHFIASTDAGHVQISGRGDRWGTANTGEGEPRVLPGLYRTPAAAAAVLSRHYDLVPYRNADELHRWREREARRAAARRRWDRGQPPWVSYHVPLAPRGYTLSTDWSDSSYRFCATTEAGRARLVGVSTHWSASVVDAADPSNSRRYGAEFVTAEEAAAAIIGAGHQVALWDRAAEQRREHPDTIPLIDEYGDTLWVVDRVWYYGLGDLATPERLPTARQMGTAGQVL